MGSPFGQATWFLTTACLQTGSRPANGIGAIRSSESAGRTNASVSSLMGRIFFEQSYFLTIAFRSTTYCSSSSPGFQVHHTELSGLQPGSFLGRALAPCVHRALLLRRVYPERPVFYHLQRWPLWRANALATKIVLPPLLPTNIAQSRAKYNWHPFPKMFEMAVGPLWPFAVPKEYTRRGAWRKSTNPNNNTKNFLWMSPNSRAPRVLRQVPPLPLTVGAILEPARWCGEGLPGHPKGQISSFSAVPKRPQRVDESCPRRSKNRRSEAHSLTCQRVLQQKGLCSERPYIHNHQEMNRRRI